jgi:hypothetical protein
MNSNKWDIVRNFYRRLSAPSPKDGSPSVFEPFCKAMIAITDKIEEKFDGYLTPKIYHHILTLQNNEANGRLYVSWSTQDIFEVWNDYLPDSNATSWENRLRVPADRVIDTIEEYFKHGKNK